MSAAETPILAYGVRLPTRDVLVLRRSLGGGCWEALSVVAERGAPRGVVAAHVSRDLDAAAARALVRTVRKASDERAAPMALETARERIARALIVDRIAGREAPEALRVGAGWLGAWEEALANVRDLYTCAECDTSLPGAWQMALARGEVEIRGALRCGCCARTRLPAGLDGLGEVSRPLAMARLMLDAGEPRRALVFLARAESDGVAPHRIAAVRGAAHLKLGNAVQAAVYLRLAVRDDPEDLAARVKLVEAEARCGLIASAVANLEVVSNRSPGSETLTSTAREALEALNPHRMQGAHALELRCLQALALLDAGRTEEARDHVDGVVDPWDAHPAARLIREAFGQAGPRPASHATAAWVAGRANDVIDGPLAELNAALMN